MTLSAAEATSEFIDAPSDVSKDESHVAKTAEEDVSNVETTTRNQATDNETDRVPNPATLRYRKSEDIFWWLSNKQKHHAICSSMLLGITIYFFIWDVTVMMPFYYKKGTYAALCHMGVQLFFYLNIAGNLFFTVFTYNDLISGDVSVRSAEKKPGWRYCEVCESYLPLQSHHCNVCNVCVLKRDHHCIFFGTCVSFKTHRYFLMLLFHYLVGGIYNLYYQFEFVWIHTGGNLLNMFVMPHLAYAAGDIPLQGLIGALLEWAGLIITSVVTYQLGRQLHTVLNGQTTYDLGHDVTTYDCGYLQNMRNALGNRWYLIWLSPIIRSPTPEHCGDFKRK